MSTVDEPLRPDAQVAAHRIWLRERLESVVVRSVILGLILFNAVTLGLTTSPWVMARVGGVLDGLDQLVLAIFVVELSVKLYAYGPSFFRNPWNVFDLGVVGLGLLPLGGEGGASALRGLRVVRALRILSAVPQMRAVVQALLDALPGMGAVIVMLAVVYYVFSVMATLLYGPTFPMWFGDLARSAYTLFQVMTLEGWSDGIVRPVMEVHPYAWAFFIPFIVMTAFSVLNLFIGLLVNTMQQAVEAEAEKEFETLRDLVRSETDQVDAHVLELKTEIRALHDELRALRKAME